MFLFRCGTVVGGDGGGRGLRTDCASTTLSKLVLMSEEGGLMRPTRPTRPTRQEKNLNTCPDRKCNRCAYTTRRPPVGWGGVPWDPKRRGPQSTDIAASVRDPALFPLNRAARKQMGTPRLRNALSFSSHEWIHPKMATGRYAHRITALLLASSFSGSG